MNETIMVDKAMQLTRQEYESASYRTPEYLKWHRAFKKMMTSLLEARGCVDIAIGKPNHFDMYGFFTIGTQPVYFSISDLRWFKDDMLIRYAKNYKDYTGGTNQYIPLTTAEVFIERVNKFIKFTKERAEILPIKGECHVHS